MTSISRFGLGVCLGVLAVVGSACGPQTLGTGMTGTTDETATGTAGTDESGTESGEQETGDAGSEEETGDGATCGDGSIAAGEACDGDDLGGQSCTDFGFLGGTLTCSEQCTINATACTNQICGNGTIEGDEECDGTDFGGINCTDLGFGPGLPLCTGDCLLDTSTCTMLGEEGDACSMLIPCASGLNCVSGICHDGGPGDPCESGDDCDSHNCVGVTQFNDGVCL
jgi:hypothetical protein